MEQDEKETKDDSRESKKQKKIKTKDFKEKKEQKHKVKKDKKVKENKKTKDEKYNNDKNSEKVKKRKKKVIIIILICLIILIIAVISFFVYKMLSRKFKDVTLELGIEELKVQDFITDESFAKDAKFLTDISTIDLKQIGTYEIELQYKDEKQKVKLTISDTTAPTVEFQDLEKYIDYQINPEDFIKSKSDLSEMTVSLASPVQISDYGTYDVTVNVKDKYDNLTSKTCKLDITWVKENYVLEYGTTLTKDMLLYNPEKDSNTISDEDMNTINSSVPGEYDIKSSLDGKEKNIHIIIQDTTPPTLELKEVTIYDDESVDTKDPFIVSAEDASGEVTTTLKTQIDNSIVGTQDVVIEAVDKYGNKTEQTTKLNRIKDTEGPVFSGVSNLSVSKNASIDYYSGVTARDAKEGKKDFTVNSSSVDTSKAGTYYAVYTSSDSKGNTTTYKRKVTVKHDSTDVASLVKEISAQCGNGVEEIRDFVRKKITYGHSYGDGDPVWYGFTNWTGNCYVHALCFQALLRDKGYETQLIWTTDKSHYWNIVKINGSWKHMDSTPDRNHRKISIMNDEQRLSTLSGRTWDRSAWPTAN